MLDDLTQEQWIGWLNYFCQDPWDEQRKDDRNAVGSLWAIAPYVTGDDLKLPGFRGPEYEPDAEQNIDDSIARIEALKKRVLNGELNRKTSDPANS
jgi:hypothetical protein